MLFTMTECDKSIHLRSAIKQGISLISNIFLNNNTNRNIIIFNTKVHRAHFRAFYHNYVMIWRVYYNVLIIVKVPETE